MPGVPPSLSRSRMSNNHAHPRTLFPPRPAKLSWDDICSTPRPPPHRPPHRATASPPALCSRESLSAVGGSFAMSSCSLKAAPQDKPLAVTDSQCAMRGVGTEGGCRNRPVSAAIALAEYPILLGNQAEWTYPDYTLVNSLRVRFGVHSALDVANHGKHRASQGSMSISKKRRFGPVLWWIVFALFGLGAIPCLWLATYGLITDDVYLPNRFGHGGLHVHGVLAWLGAGIEYCLAASLISFIVRFGLDPSQHRPFYRSFDKWLKYIAFGLLAGFFLALISTVHKQ